MDLVMEKVAVMPPSRGRRGYAEQAAQLRDELMTADGPVRVAVDSTRNGLETLSRHLRDYPDVATVVAIHAKNDIGEPTSYALFAEYKPL